MQTRKDEQYWGEWSRWVLDKKHNRYYRARQDADGNIDYEWDGAGRGADEHKKPRRGVDDLSSQLSGVHLSEADDNYPSEYTTEEKSSRHSDRPHKSRRESQSSSRQQYSDRPPRSSRESQMASERSSHSSRKNRDHYQDAPYSNELVRISGHDAPQFESSGYDMTQYSERDRPISKGKQRASRAADAYYEQAPKERSFAPREYQRNAIDEDYDAEEMRRATEQSRQYQYSQPNRQFGESSQESYHTGRHGMGGDGSSVGAYEAFTDDYEDEGPSTPRALERVDQNDNDTEKFLNGLEKLDPRYRIEKSRRFQPGEIFKVYWAEPAGMATDNSTVTSKKQVDSKYGKFWVGFRRFIVVANDEGNCTCLPILTYRSRGCLKRGVKPAKHGIIYQKGRRPQMLDDEPELGRPAIAAVMTAEGEKLAKESRINYAKLVTLEHNTPVFFIGHVASDHFDSLIHGMNQAWAQKEFGRRRGRD